MKFNITTLDDKKKVWTPSSNVRANPSNLHIQARELILEKYPTSLLMEEVYFPIFSTQNRVFDFLIPHLFKIYEVQGEQHFKFTPFFHASKLDFRKDQVADMEKLVWCEQNGFKLIHLCHFETVDEWRNKL